MMAELVQDLQTRFDKPFFHYVELTQWIHDLPCHRTSGCGPGPMYLQEYRAHQDHLETLWSGHVVQRGPTKAFPSDLDGLGILANTLAQGHSRKYGDKEDHVSTV